MPQLFYIGTDQSIPNYEFHVMVMELLGKSLEDLFEACGHQFDLKTCCMVALQMI